MEIVLKILLVWFVVSVPVSLLVGKLLAAQSRIAQPKYISDFSRYVSQLETQEIPVG
ncbi:MAG: hypothetical protein KC547_02610 [Anaerolineae bacterium]|nr:hypothetical protein [Anaerolineae bacterium]MCA9910256.1 hypothetical protein [Anaerolineae bacterium]